MIVKILISIVLVLQQAYSQLPPCVPTEYTFNNLVLSWPRQLCSQKSKCKKNWRKMWDNKTLTIHGFWPSSTNLAFLSCLKQNRQTQWGPHDSNCFRPYHFSFSKFSIEEKASLSQSWPHLTTMQKNFLQYEWDKHGTCYLYLQHNGTKVTLSDDDIFREYMLGTVAKKLELNITLESKTFQTKEEFSQRIGIPSQNYIAICKKNYFSEIRICYTLGSPGKEQMRKCPPSTDRSICQFPIIVR